MYSGFFGPYNHYQNEISSPPEKLVQKVQNENYEDNVENEIFNFLKEAKAEMAGIFSKVPNIIPKIPSYGSFGTSNLNMLRLA